MVDIEKVIRMVDFSRYTDLKVRLAERLFSKKGMTGAVPAFSIRITDEEAAYVSAAQGNLGNDSSRKEEKPFPNPEGGNPLFGPDPKGGNPLF